MLTARLVAVNVVGRLNADKAGPDRPGHPPEGDPMTDTIRRNRSAACGAWQVGERNAHEYCRGIVALPAPDDVCSCWCHGREGGEPFTGNAEEWEAYAEAHREWESEVRHGSTLSFAEWLIAD